MGDEKQVERIWVGIPQAAEITGRRKEYLRQLMSTTWEMSAEERPLKVRHRSNRYEFWLPDLIPYIENTEDASERLEVEPIWVSTGEAEEITGYRMDYLRQLAFKLWQQPEGERPIKIRVRARRYELWLPDLIKYVQSSRGPYNKQISQK